MKNRNIGSVVESLGELCNGLAEYKEYFDEQVYSNLVALKENLKNNLAEIEDENRLLRIGIVGGVKAGKSTFTNTLLFEGKGILPEAPTPETATLTRLTYSSTSELILHFYSEQEWEGIKGDAAEAEKLLEKSISKKRDEWKKKKPYSDAGFDEQSAREKAIRKLPNREKAGLELVENAKQSDINIAEYIGQTKSFPLAVIDDAQQKLREAVGRDGKLAGIVKYVELHLDHPFLSDIEIIDTPGLNDAVISRSYETQKALSTCDAVLFLSKSENFLNQHDLEMLRCGLSDEGIGRVEILVSKMDSGVADHDGGTFKEAFGRTLNSIMERVEQTGIAKPPICISSLFAGCAYKISKGEELTEDEKHTLESLKRFSGMPQRPEELFSVSNMKKVVKVLEEIRGDKDEIILQKKHDLIKSKLESIARFLESLQVSARHRLECMQSCDYNELAEKRAQIEKARSGLQQGVPDIFRKYSQEAARSIGDLQLRVVKRVSKYSSLEVSSVTKTKETSYQTGWIFKKTHYRTQIIRHKTAEISCALKMLREYGVRVHEEINDEFRHILDVDSLKKKVKEKVSIVFNLVDVEEEDVLDSLGVALGALTIPEFEFDNSEYTTRLRSRFTGEILDENVLRLKEDLDVSLESMSNDICHNLKRYLDKIAKEMELQAENFSDALVEKLTEQISILQKQLENKEANIANYNKAIEHLEIVRNEFK